MPTLLYLRLSKFEFVIKFFLCQFFPNDSFEMKNQKTDKWLIGTSENIECIDICSCIELGQGDDKFLFFIDKLQLTLSLVPTKGIAKPINTIAEAVSHSSKKRALDEVANCIRKKP